MPQSEIDQLKEDFYIAEERLRAARRLAMLFVEFSSTTEAAIDEAEMLKNLCQMRILAERVLDESAVGTPHSQQSRG